MTGLGAALVVFLVLAFIGVAGSDRNPVILILLELLALVGAGYVAGRFAPSNAAAHGGMAGLALFFVAAAISIALAPNSTGFELLVFGLVAAVLGSAGGAIAERRRDD
jgi:hypothetical protein